MSFAVAGLKTPGIRIENETCVEKSFPEFWKVFESLYCMNIYLIGYPLLRKDIRGKNAFNASGAGRFWIPMH